MLSWYTTVFHLTRTFFRALVPKYIPDTCGQILIMDFIHTIMDDVYPWSLWPLSSLENRPGWNWEWEPPLGAGMMLPGLGTGKHQLFCSCCYLKWCLILHSQAPCGLLSHETVPDLAGITRILVSKNVSGCRSHVSCFSPIIYVLPPYPSFLSHCHSSPAALVQQRPSEPHLGPISIQLLTYLVSQKQLTLWHLFEALLSLFCFPCLNKTCPTLPCSCYTSPRHVYQFICHFSTFRCSSAPGFYS